MKRITGKGLVLALGLCTAVGSSAGVQISATFDPTDSINEAYTKGTLFGSLFNKSTDRKNPQNEDNKSDFSFRNNSEQQNAQLNLKEEKKQDKGSIDEFRKEVNERFDKIKANQQNVHSLLS